MTRQELLSIVPEAGAAPTLPRPAHAAFLVIDMQEEFRSVAMPILAPLRGVIDACRASSVPVVFTQHGHTDPTRDGGMLSQWWGQLIMRGSPAWQFLPEVAPLPEELVVAKTRYSAFFRTSLGRALRSLRAKDLIIGGVMSNLCCETTARDAFVRDFRVFFLADGTATASAEYHHATLRNLAYGFAYLVTCEEVVQALRQSSAPVFMPRPESS